MDIYISNWSIALNRILFPRLTRVRFNELMHSVVVRLEQDKFDYDDQGITPDEFCMLIKELVKEYNLRCVGGNYGKQ